MSSVSSNDVARGARKRTTTIISTTRIRRENNHDNISNIYNNPSLNDTEDSGLSSESTTPTGGSPPPRQQRQKNNSSTNNIQNIIHQTNTVAIRALCDRGRIGSGRTSRLLRSRSGTDSPRSLDSVRTRQVSSPLRPPRNIQSPSLDSGDEGSLRLERGTYQHMFQDIVSIKTMLLKLKRVLQELEENGLTRAETLNPFDNSMKNGLFYNLNEGGTTEASTSPGTGEITVADELADLRRQVVFLQGQLEDRDRTVHLLQLQMTKYQGINGLDSQCSTSSSCISNEPRETSNAATQTDKVRPVSAGPLLLQSLPQDGNVGPLVSWSELWNQQPNQISSPTSPPVINAYRRIRKPSDNTSNLMIRSRKQDHHHQGRNNQEYADKPIAESSPIKNIQKSKESSRLMINRSSDINNGTTFKDTQNRNDTITSSSSSTIKSSIPTPRRLNNQTLIPRAARAVSATGRSHNP